jgi:hypothetical protein
MFVGGLWHGAAWTFVIWGALHGAALVVERIFAGKLGLPAVIRWFLAFHVIVLLFIIFRSPDLGIAADMYGQLTDWGAATLWTVPAVLAVTVVVGLQLVPRGIIEEVRLRIEALNAPALGLGLAAVVVIVAATVPSQGVPPFIYFQF